MEEGAGKRKKGRKKKVKKGRSKKKTIVDSYEFPVTYSSSQKKKVTISYELPLAPGEKGKEKEEGKARQGEGKLLKYGTEDSFDDVINMYLRSVQSGKDEAEYSPIPKQRGKETPLSESTYEDIPTIISRREGEKKEKRKGKKIEGYGDLPEIKSEEVNEEIEDGDLIIKEEKEDDVGEPKELSYGIDVVEAIKLRELKAKKAKAKNKKNKEESSEASDNSETDSGGYSSSSAWSTTSDSDSDSGAEDGIEILSSRLLLPKNLTTKVEHQNKWNTEFQNLYDRIYRIEVGLKAKGALISEEEEGVLVSLYYAMGCLYQNFVRVAKLYTEHIVNELFLPDSVKTISPANVGGIAGGDKYIAEGIFFKCVLPSAKYYDGLANASKSPSLELKSFNAIYNLGVSAIHLPLFVCIDYRGFRVSAMNLLPINKRTHKYGSSDAGITFKEYDEDLNDIMYSIGERLNLAPHAVGKNSIATATLPADIEGHVGTDDRYYILDTARIFPPEPRSAPCSYLYRLLRPELVKTSPKPLCSDSFSSFDIGSQKADHILDIKHVHDELKGKVIQGFAEYLLKTYNTQTPVYSPGEPLYKLVETGLWKPQCEAERVVLKEEMHKRGINMRLLGLVWEAVSGLEGFDPAARRFWLHRIAREIVLRAATPILFALMQRALKSIKLKGEKSFVRVAVEYLNLLLGNSQESREYWEAEFKTTILLCFFYPKLLDNNIGSSNVSGTVDQLLPRNFLVYASAEENKPWIADQLTRSAGVVLRTRDMSIEAFDSAQPFDDNSIVNMLPTVKCMDVVHYSNVIRLYKDLFTSTNLIGETDSLMELYEELHQAHYALYRSNSWFIPYQMVKIHLSVMCRLQKIQSETEKESLKFSDELKRLASLQEGEDAFTHIQPSLIEKIRKAYESVEREREKIVKLRAQLMCIEDGSGCLVSMKHIVNDNTIFNAIAVHKDLCKVFSEWARQALCLSDELGLCAYVLYGRVCQKLSKGELYSNVLAKIAVIHPPAFALATCNRFLSEYSLPIKA